MPDEALIDLSDYISEKLGQKVIDHGFANDELVFNVRVDDIASVLQFLRDDRECEFRVLLDVCGVDYPDRPLRFEVVYTLLSMTQNNRARVKVGVEEDQIVPSVTGVFSSAGWFEREVWDMYGILFSGNPDLRRILTDYGFDGHPQRKDFPLTGYVELRYDEEQKRVVYEPVQLQQDFRRFDFTSPWEGMVDVQLPGDEKGVIPPHGWVSTGQNVNDVNNDNTEELAEEEGDDHASEG